mgnify:CR=1 FL=1
MCKTLGIANHNTDKGADYVWRGMRRGTKEKRKKNEWSEWNEWNDLITGLLCKNYWVTLDFDVSYANEIHEQSWNEFLQFIPMISVKLPYSKLLGYNATIKLDDKDFKATNPGVWCHNLHDLKDRNTFTTWLDYKNDKIIK